MWSLRTRVCPPNLSGTWAKPRPEHCWAGARAGGFRQRRHATVLVVERGVAQAARTEHGVVGLCEVRSTGHARAHRSPHQRACSGLRRWALCRARKPRVAPGALASHGRRTAGLLPNRRFGTNDIVGMSRGLRPRTNGCRVLLRHHRNGHTQMVRLHDAP
jgi:hypothetical protein